MEPLFFFVALILSNQDDTILGRFHSPGSFPIEECTREFVTDSENVYQQALEHGLEEGTFHIAASCLEAPQPGQDG